MPLHIHRMVCSAAGVLHADPYLNDATFTISMLTLEELGATGNKVGCGATRSYLTQPSQHVTGSFRQPARLLRAMFARSQMHTPAMLPWVCVS